MLKKIPKEYLILGGVIVLLVLVLVFMNLAKGCTGQSLPSLGKIKAADLTKIVFSSAAGGELTLEKDNNGKWRIQPMQYPADKAAIESMISNITDVEIRALRSDKKIYDMYNLDDANKITVSGFAGDKLVRNFDIGKTSDTSSFTFVRLSNNPNVYDVKGNVRAVFDKKIADIRDKIVMNINREEITELVLETEGKTVHIKKEIPKTDPAATPDKSTAAAQTPVWKSDLSDKPVTDTIINELFDGMVNLTCDEFIKGKTKQDFTDKPFYYRITARGTKDYTITYMDKGVDNKYTAITSESDYPSLIIGWKATKLTRKIENGEIK